MEILEEGDEDEAAFLALIESRHSSLWRSSLPGGSRPGKAPNKLRDAASRHLRLLPQYFGPNPIYKEDDFRTRFRMSRRLFIRVLKAVVEDDPYFVQRPEATGKMGISSLLKVSATLRQLAYASTADAFDENLEMSETAALKCLKRFCKSVIKCFGAEYLRAPTPNELQTILEHNAQRGFVGMIGSVDCMHWEWRNFPSAVAGQHKGKGKKPTKVLEAVADYNLRIWHCNFGSPGSLNDINVLDQSPLFDDMLQGRAPRIEFTLSGNKYYTPYLLADGMYPDWPVFVKPMESAHGNKEKYFAGRQEACRKDVQRCFGVLQARWRVIGSPCRLWKGAMSTMMHACIILHNMIIDDQANDPHFSGNDYLFTDAAQPGGIPCVQVQ
ncbi:hypothetical protein PC128_g25901 [Phytophthora cactorum]|nr:hypothetical protein PC120_g21147 [Phytophthora cactorum]KAG3136416.1 hypothetical protein PC128_g25901 [Phytophthora cactorum]KAG4042906.1 hypothetical protein PC123_g21619 [Phytophthora cactorum]